MEGFACSGFTFYNAFDSSNLAKVAFVPPNESVTALSNKPPEVPDAEFNLWTKPDCCGTEFENGNRTWFYFGVRAPSPALLVRLNIVDLNRQGKMYSQGMAPVYRVVPGKIQWDRIRDKPTFNTVDEVCTLTFKFKTPENLQSVTYFAFTYPFSYSDLQKMLSNIDLRFENYIPSYEDDIYYTKEVVCRSLGGRDVNLLTVSSYHGITPEVEVRLKNLFPDENVRRPFKFVGKKVIFISARVHPGETPSSFVFNGLLNLLLSRDDPVGLALRRLYVFKLIPFLNPDGVSLGHYRTDTRGVNLNRVYLAPSLALHPTVYAARALLRYYHWGGEREEGTAGPEGGDHVISAKVSNMSLEEEDVGVESGLFLYVDLHGHASKKGIFMYGNHFEGLERSVECMLLPKLMSINSHHFHFGACNFTERNMYLRDRRDGMSREGSGRVAVLKLTGLTKSYTLECNYNTGRIVNVLPATVKEGSNKPHTIMVPPKYNPQVFEEVGKSLGAAILDLTGQNPYTRLPNSEFHSVAGLKDWLRLNFAEDPRKIQLRNNQGKGARGHTAKARPATVPKRLAPVRPRPGTAPKDGPSQQQPPFRLALKSKAKKEFGLKFKRSASATATEKKFLRTKGTDTDAKPKEAWRPSCSAQTFSGRSRFEEGPEAGPSRQSFSKNSTFAKCKFKKHTLRRLTSEGGKGEKGKKRKKHKGK